MLRIEDSIASERHRMRADEGRVKQVLLNLVQNAINDSTRESTVSVDIFLDDLMHADLGRINASSIGSSN